MTIRMVFAPAGAWTTRSNCINAIDIPTASVTVNIPSPNKLMARSPIRAETKFPPMTLLGCANGALGSANSKTHVAPKGAIIDGTPTQ